MRSIHAAATMLLVLMSPAPFFAQPSQSAQTITVPRVINISGVFTPMDGRPLGREAFDGGMLERALKLRPIYYKWRVELMQNRIPDNAGEAYGLIAQDVEKIYPEMVTTTDDGYKAVDYGKLQYVLLGALQEEHAKVEALDAKVATLEKRLAKLEAMADGASYPTVLGPALWMVLAGLGAMGFAFYRRS